MFRQLPNLITFSRIGVLAALVWLVFEDWTGAATLAFFCILYGSVSDFIDGYIARKYNLITDFGKILDALVDKVMTLGAFFLLWYVGILYPSWLTLICIIGIAVREIGITLMRILAARKGVVLAAEKAGKRKTIWQVTGICVLFAVPMIGQDLARIWPVDLGAFVDFVWLNGMAYFFYATWLTVSSGTVYLSHYGKHVFSAEGGTP